MFNDEPTQKDKAVQELEQRLEDEKDRRKEERFYWVCALVLVLDFHFFTEMPTWGAPIALGLIQAFVLITLAKAWGIDFVETVFLRVVDTWKNGTKNN